MPIEFFPRKWCREREKARKIISAHSEWTRPSDEQNRLCSWWLHVKDQSPYFWTNHPMNQISDEMSISEEWLDKRPLLSLDRCRAWVGCFNLSKRTTLVSLVVFFFFFFFVYASSSDMCVSAVWSKNNPPHQTRFDFSLLPWRARTYKQKAPSPYFTRPRRQQSRCLTSYFNTSFHGDQWTQGEEEKNASMMSNTCCREESYKNASNLSSRQSERTLTFSTLSDVSIRNWDWRVSNNRFWPEELLIRNIGSYSPLFFLIAQNESRIFLTCLSSMPWPMISFPVITDAIGRLVIISRMPMQHFLPLLFQKQTHTSITLIYFQIFSAVWVHRTILLYWIEQHNHCIRSPLAQTTRIIKTMRSFWSLHTHTHSDWLSTTKVDARLSSETH